MRRGEAQLAFSPNSIVGPRVQQCGRGLWEKTLVTSSELEHVFLVVCNLKSIACPCPSSIARPLRIACPSPFAKEAVSLSHDFKNLVLNVKKSVSRSLS